MQKFVSTNYKRNIFLVTVILSFIALMIYNVLTPLMSDDLLFYPHNYRSFADVIRAEYIQYMTWTGRSVLQIILKIFSITPKWFFNICNSLCFILLMLLIYWNVDKKEKYYTALYVLINLFVWNFGVEIGRASCRERV